MKTYELFLHWKQGDDFRGCLEQAKGNVSEALEFWARDFDSRAKHCRELAERVKGKSVETDADTHMITFGGDEELLDKLVEEELLSAFEVEDDEETY